MKKNFVKVFILPILVMSHTSFGYFYHLCVLRIINKQTNKPQFIIGLADFHDKNHPANAIQRGYIDGTLLPRCGALHGKFIVEDLSSVNNDGRMHCCHFGINASDGVLSQLASKARAAGIAVDNVEYRYCRVAGIGPLLAHIHARPAAFKSTSTITLGALYKEIVNEIEKIQKYDDGAPLNTLYKRTVAAVKHALAKIGFYPAQQKLTIAHYCARLPHKQYRQELENLCIFDSALIDMNIMHAIAASPDAPCIIVVAGGSHIDQMNEMLKPLGYELIFATQQPLCATIKNEVNAGTSIAAGAAPRPIDLTVLDKFIN